MKYFVYFEDSFSFYIFAICERTPLNPYTTNQYNRINNP